MTEQTATPIPIQAGSHDHDCDNCESTVDVENEPAYCHNCYSTPWQLVDDLLKAIDPTLAAEMDSDNAESPTIPVGKACAQAKAQRAEIEKMRAVMEPPPVMYLPAQMGELREKLENISLLLRLNPVAIDLALARLGEALRLVPIQHDDQQGGQPLPSGAV